VARYISKASGFKKTVIKGEQTLVQGPQGPTVSILRDAHIALFEQGNVTPWEVERAAEVWGRDFKGVAEGEAPLKRISAYDTDLAAERNGWDAKTKADVEKLLDAQQGQDYFRVDLPRLAAPWPKYDDAVDADQIAAIAGASLEADGVTHAIAYELENLARPDVIAALEEILEVAGDEVSEEELVGA